MNITQINHVQPNNNKNISFKSGQLLSNIFMAIDNHEIIGVTAVDLASMVIPRSVIDFTRNRDAGIETATREGISSATHASIGLAGLGAASLLALTLRHKNYNVDFKNVTANDATLDGLATVFKSTLDRNPNISKDELTRKFLNIIFEDVQGLSGNSDLKDKKIWYSLKQGNQTIAGESVNTKQSIVDILFKAQKENKSFKLPSNILDKLLVYLNTDIPSTQTLNVKLGDKIVTTDGKHFLEDVYSLTKAFNQEGVLNTFKKAVNSQSVEFVKDLKKLSIRKTILGLSAMSAFALSIQSINRHITKKRTGIDGFVGDPEFQNKSKIINGDNKKTKDRNALFMPLKLLAMLTMGFYIYKTINASGLKDLASKLQFKSSLPTINQIKVVYGSNILGRLFAANDTNELRESAFRDFLGFTNFLVLGALVTKCFVNWKDKSLITYSEKDNGKGLWNWLKNSKIKTHQEVINNTLKQNVISEKGIKPLKELYKNNWIKPNGEIAKKLSVLNKAKAIGIIYSCIALGIVVPLINKHITEAKHKKSKRKTAPINQDNYMKDNSSQPKIQNIKSQKIISDFWENNKLTK